MLNTDPNIISTMPASQPIKPNAEQMNQNLRYFLIAGIPACLVILGTAFYRMNTSLAILQSRVDHLEARLQDTPNSIVNKFTHLQDDILSLRQFEGNFDSRLTQVEKKQMEIERNLVNIPFSPFVNGLNKRVTDIEDGQTQTVSFLYEKFYQELKGRLIFEADNSGRPIIILKNITIPGQ